MERSVITDSSPPPPSPQANNGPSSSSLLADDESVIEQLVGQLTAACKDLPAGFKLAPVTFEKVG